MNREIERDRSDHTLPRSDVLYYESCEGILRIYIHPKSTNVSDAVISALTSQTF